ncbi:MAG TPA: oligosaccharide flippase family protein [Thermoleophilaceae bacterium]|nr:oligosaccharide flippase family protein [Thermoleophilaceae bacterium]
MATSVLGTEAGPPTGERDDLRLSGAPDRKIRSAGTDAALFTGATYLAQILMFAAGLLQKGLLGPVGAGYWALMQAFWVYLTIGSLGTMAGTGRQIPVRRGRGDLEGAAAVANTGSTFSVVAVGIVGTLVAAVALVAGGGWPDEIRYGLVLLGVLAPLRIFADAQRSIMQAVKRFDVASVTAVVEAAVTLTLGTLCVVFFGFYGMFAGVLLTVVGMYISWARLGMATWRRPAFAWRFDRRLLGELMSFGFPIMLQGQIWLLFMSIDNLIVAGFISVKELGYYALAVSVTGYVLHLPRSVGAALFPRMTETFGETGDVRSIRHFAVDTQRLLAYLLVPLFLGGAYFLVPVLIRHALPEFEPAIPVVHIMVAGSFLMALMNMPTKMLTTAGYRWGVTALGLLCLAINAGANFLAVAVFDWGLEGAAGATVLSYLLAFLIMTSYALSKAFTRREVFLHICELLGVIAYVIGAAWGVELVIGSGAGPLVSDALVGIAKVALFVLAIAPLLLLSERRYQGLTRIRGMVVTAVRKVADRRR